MNKMCVVVVVVTGRRVRSKRVYRIRAAMLEGQHATDGVHSRRDEAMAALTLYAKESIVKYQSKSVCYCTSMGAGIWYKKCDVV